MIVRFVWSFLFNVCRAGFTFATGIIVARVLGPSEFGVFSYIIATGIAIFQFVDLGSSNAFYTLICRTNSKPKAFFRIYWFWILIQILIVVSFVFLLDEYYFSNLFPDINKYLVCIGMLAVALQYRVWNAMTQILESARLTTVAQGVSFLIAALHLVFTGALILLEKANVDNIFILLVIEFFVVSICCYIFWGRMVELSNEPYKVKGFYGEFKGYCKPLVLYTFFSMLAVVFERWLLQSYGGSLEQGYFSIATQFSSVCLLLATSILKVFWKEISEEFSLGNYEKVWSVYTTTTSSLYFFSCAMACFLIPWVPFIIDSFLGESYREGLFVICLMFLYPIHQTIGQIVGSTLLAMGHTKVYTQIALLGLALSAICSYILIAPSDNRIPGFELGSTGLAVSMLLVQLINALLYSRYIAKALKKDFKIAYQFYSFVILILISYVSYISSSFLGVNSISVMIVCAFLYSILTFGSILFLPSIFNLKNEVAFLKTNAKSFFCRGT